MVLPPFYFRRAWLRAFWVSLVLAALLVLTTWRSIFGTGLPLPWVWLGGTVLLGIGLTFPQLVRLPYFAFRHASVLLSQVTGAVLAVFCYFGVLLPMSVLDRPRLRFERPAWRRWPSTTFGQGTPPLRYSPRMFRATLPAFREPWELALAPFIYLSRLFGTPVEVEQRSDTYTLY